MGSNKFDDSGVMDLTKNIMIMLFIGLFMIIIFVVLVYFYSKSRVPQAMEDNDSRVYEQQGLDTSFLKTIRVIQFDPKDFNEGIECAVCLSDLKEGETARILPKCDHGFHVECIDMWFHSHSTCPVCRNPIIDQTDIKLEQEESTNVLLVEEEANNDHQASSSEQASSSSSLLTYKNRERPHLVIDIPPREVIVEEDEKTPVSSSRMRSLKRILSNSASFNPFSPGSQSATNSELHIQPVKS